MSRYKNYIGYSKYDHRIEYTDCEIILSDDEDEDIFDDDFERSELIIKIYETIRNIVTSIGIPIFDREFTHEAVEDYLEEADII